MIFKGICTAIVTPFNKDKSIDFVAFKKLIDYQVSNNVDAVLVLGTTGESSTISREERVEIIKFAKKIINKKCKLIVGTGSNDTKKAIELSNEAKYLGADGCLIVTPYYNKCTQSGLIEHYKIISENVNFPFIVYNVPSRTGVNIEPITLNKISKLLNFAGIKEANGDINHILKVFHQNPNIPIYCGNDNLNLIFKNLGASGLISVTSNAYPQYIVSLWKKKQNAYIQNKLFEFNELMFVETNPIPIKYSLFKKKLIKNELRLPLTKLKTKNKKLIDLQIKYLEE